MCWPGCLDPVGALGPRQQSVPRLGAGEHVRLEVQLGRDVVLRNQVPALEALGHAPEDAVMIGDRPSKDIDGAARVGVRGIRVLTGEYATDPDGVAPWHTCADAAEALDLVLAEVGAAALA